MIDRALLTAAIVQRAGRALLLLLLLALPGIAALPASAQTAPAATPAPPAPAPVSAAELERLVNTLQNDAQRAQLVTELRGLIAAQRGIEPQQPATPATVLGDLSGRISSIGGEVVAAAAVVVDAPRLFSWLRYQVTDPAMRALWLEVGLKLGVVFGFALFAEWALRTLLQRPRRALTGHVGHHVILRLILMAGRAVIDAIPILAFAGVAYVVLPATHPRFATERVATTLIEAYVTTRIIVALARVILLPRLSAPLFGMLSEEVRTYLFVWIKRFAYTGVYGYAIPDGAWWLGVPGSIYALLLKGVALLLAILATIFVLQNRSAVSEWLRGRAAEAAAEGEASGWRVLRNRFADTWHVLAIVYIAGIYLVYALRIEGGFIFVLRATILSVAVILVARVAVSLVHRASRRGFAIGSDLKTKFPTLEARANRYLPILTAAAAMLVYAFAALAILQAWNVSAFSWFDSEFGRRITGGLASIATVVVLALVLWELFSSGVERYLSGVDGRGVPVSRSARARTLLPLLRTTVLVVLLVLVALIVLSQLGVDIAPLLAGAGVVGLAIGFGSQALVKDVITGLFILVEDTLAVGDVVDVGKGHSGVVEAISIRTIRLRDGAGALHSVPFSEVTSVANMTRDYAYSVANVSISYREDPDRVSAVLKEVGADLMADGEYRPFILEPLEVVGIDKMSELGMVIQMRIKTLARKQWAVGREFSRRMKKEFDRRGIEMPYAMKPGYLADIAAAAEAERKKEADAAADGQQVKTA